MQSAALFNPIPPCQRPPASPDVPSVRKVCRRVHHEPRLAAARAVSFRLPHSGPGYPFRGHAPNKLFSVRVEMQRVRPWHLRPQPRIAAITPLPAVTHHTTPHYPTLHHTTPHCTDTPRYTLLPHTAPRYTTLPHTAPRYTTRSTRNGASRSRCCYFEEGRLARMAARNLEGATHTLAVRADTLNSAWP